MDILSLEVSGPGIPNVNQGGGAAGDCDCDWEAVYTDLDLPFAATMPWGYPQATVTGTVEVGATVTIVSEFIGDTFHELTADCVEVEGYKFRFAGEGATEWEYGPLTADDFGLYRMMHQGYPGYFILCPGGAAPEEGEPAAEGEIDYPPPVTEGAPVAGMLGLGLVAAACALGSAVTLRKK